nr:MAG TPA_asm: hypothetical protein [Bacteriophage sp.]
MNVHEQIYRKSQPVSRLAKFLKITICQNAT